MAGLVQLLAARAGDEPDAIAFLVDGAGRLTYGAWERASNAMARGLAGRGLGRGDRFVLCFDTLHWVDYAVACAAVAKLGAVSVPVRAGRSLVERVAIARHCGAAGTITPSDVAGLVDGYADTPLPPVGGGERLEINYPSGHLRAPRPTDRSEDEVLSALVELEGHCVLHAFAVGSDPARLALWAPLGPRAPMVVTVGALDPGRVCALSEELGVDTWWLVAATALLVVESGALDGHDTSSVRRVLLAGPPPPAALVSRLRDALDAEVRVSPAATGPAGSPDGPADAGPADVAPVAFSQEGMLWQEQFVPGSQNLPPLVRRFKGALEVGALEAAIDEIVRRHEPLRSRFELRDGRLVQIVAAHRGVALPVHDLGGLDPGDQQAELAAVLAHAGRPFDLVAGPLFEPALFRFAPDDHVVVFRVHHSVYDDWSVSVFRRELSALYTAFAAGEASPLPDLAVGFAEFARNQRRRLAGPVGTAQLAWWKDHLAGAPFCLQLPIDDPARAEGSPQHSAQPVTVVLGDELHARVRLLARRHRATPFMAMLAAFEVLVHRYTGQDDLLMASVVANRNRPELEPMIGCFTKKILLRQDMAGDPTFAEVLARTRVSVLGALPNQDLAFETVLQETVGAAAAEHGLVPYVGVMFQGVTPQVDEVVLPGVTTTGYDTSATTTRAHFAAGTDDEPTGDGAASAGDSVAAPGDSVAASGDGGAVADDGEPWGCGLYAGTFLILSLVEAPEATSLVARGAFHRPAVERLLDSFVTLLGDIVDDPDRPISELALLTADQRRQLDAGSTVDPVSVGVSACHLFEAQADATPSAVAVVGAGRTVTFAALQARVDRLAAHLRTCGVGPGSLVGICLEASEHSVVAVLAVWRAGAAYVGLDPDDDGDHLAWVVADAALTVVVTRSGLSSHVMATGCRLVDPDPDPDADADADAGADPDATAGVGRPAVSGDGTPAPGDVALVFYGGRESAVPQGVAIEHGNIVNLVAGLGAAIFGPAGAGLRVWLGAGPTGDGFLRQVAALLGGHTLHVADVPGGTAGERERAEQVVSLVAAGAVDLLDGSPAQLEALVDTGIREALLARPTGAVRPTIIVGFRGAPDRRSWARLRALPRARTHVLFGPPECSFGAAADGDLADGDLADGERVTIGRPLTDVSVGVLDPSGRPAPVQVIGELYVGGAGLARHTGTAAIAPGNVAPSVRRFRTGQRARLLPDGRIELVGAVADAVDLRGYRVDRARLQTALSRCPGVGEARVVVEPGPEGTPQLVVYVVPQGDVVPTLARLRVCLWTQLPGYAWPAAVVAVAGGRTSKAAERTPVRRAGDTGVGEETLLGALWAEVAGIARVDPAENYWQSFAFLEAVTRAAEAGIPIGNHQIARNRTLATLAVDLAAAPP